MSIDFLSQQRHMWMNRVQTWLLVGGSLTLLVVCAWVFFGPDGILFAAVFGVISLFIASRVSPQMVLRMYRAVPVSRQQFPVGHAILDQLVQRAGLPEKPVLYVLPSNVMNAFAVGRQSDSALCLTDRLIRSLTQRELAGVMAHEVSHIKAEDVRVMAIADMVSRFTSAMAMVGLISLALNLPALLMGGAVAVPWLGIVLLLGAPTIGGLLQTALSRAREYDADLGAVMLTGDPDGMASALIKLESAQRRHWEGMMLPGGRVPQPSLLRTHPPTEDRVARLMALKGGDATPPLAPQPAGPRPTSVPQVRPRWGRGEQARYFDHARLLGAHPVAPVVEPGEADDICAEQSLHPPRRAPRIHVSRGGVYW